MIRILNQGEKDLINKGKFSYSKRQYKDALKYLSQAININDSNSSTFNDRGKVYQRLKMNL